MAKLEPVEEERGVIINTASIVAQDGQAGSAAYAAAKAGVVGMTQPVARDLASEAIRHNTILPGPFATPLYEGMAEDLKQTIADSVPFPKRLGIPKEYAELVLHIIGNTYLNGECIRIDGGTRLRT